MDVSTLYLQTTECVNTGRKGKHPFSLAVLEDIQMKSWLRLLVVQSLVLFWGSGFVFGQDAIKKCAVEKFNNEILGGGQLALDPASINLVASF